MTPKNPSTPKFRIDGKLLSDEQVKHLHEKQLSTLALAAPAEKLLDEHNNEVPQQDKIIDYRKLPLSSVSISTFCEDTTVEFRFGDVLDKRNPQRVVKVKNVDKPHLNQIGALCNNRFHTSVFYFVGGPVVQWYTGNAITPGGPNWFDWSANVNADFIRPKFSTEDVVNRLLEIMDKLVQERQGK